jgi:hypothetical protein
MPSNAESVASVAAVDPGGAEHPAHHLCLDLVGDGREHNAFVHAGRLLDDEISS